VGVFKSEFGTHTQKKNPTMLQYYIIQCCVLVGRSTCVRQDLKAHNTLFFCCNPWYYDVFIAIC